MPSSSTHNAPTSSQSAYVLPLENGHVPFKDPTARRAFGRCARREARCRECARIVEPHIQLRTLAETRPAPNACSFKTENTQALEAQPCASACTAREKTAYGHLASAKAFRNEKIQ